MENIWEEIISEPEIIRFRQADHLSPYCETLDECVRNNEDGSKTISVNAFYRFDKVFLTLLEGDETSVEKDFLYDALYHYMTRFELKKGMSKRELKVRSEISKLAEGKYGKEIKDLFNVLDKNSQYIIGQANATQESIGESVMLFSKTIVNLLDDGIVYKNRVDEREILLYLARELRQSDRDKIELAKIMFLPLEYNLRVYERDSFGVIDFDKSMNLGEIVLF